MIKLPLVGPAYKMQSQSISCQNCINWYPQTIEYPNGSRVAALMPTPGLKKLFIGEVAATRCLYVLSNGALLAVIGKKLYHSKSNKLELTEIGLISALGTVRIADNGQVALIVNGTYTYAFDLKTLTLTRLSGSTIPRSTHVLFLDGRFVVNKVNTGQFYWSDLYSTKVNALSYATAESTPDNITAIVTFNRELWLFGAQSVERYYGTGSSNSPFSRLSGGAMAFGCLAPDSIVSLATGVIWLGVSEFGGNQIVMSGGGIPDRISTHALEEEISSFSKTSDASAYAYQIEGHVFYVISFPSANVTYCFDVSTGLWHQRSFTNAQGLHERHRSQHHAYFNNTHIVGDYRNGKLYQLDNNTFTDDGELILRERTAQAVITDQKLTRFNQLQIICETGFYGEVKKEGNSCEAFGAEVLQIENSLPPGRYYLNFKVNNGELKTIDYTADSYEHPYDVAKALFGRIADDKGWRLFILGGGSQAVGEDGEYHPAPFWAYLFGTIDAAETMYGSEEEYVNEPVTVEFTSNPSGIGTDAVGIYFGQNTTIHACSYKTWIGV